MSFCEFVTTFQPKMAQFSKITVEPVEQPGVTHEQRHIIMRYVLRKAIRLSVRAIYVVSRKI